MSRFLDQIRKAKEARRKKAEQARREAAAQSVETEEGLVPEQVIGKASKIKRAAEEEKPVQDAADKELFPQKLEDKKPIPVSDAAIVSQARSRGH